MYMYVGLVGGLCLGLPYLPLASLANGAAPRLASPRLGWAGLGWAGLGWAGCVTHGKPTCPARAP